MGLGDENILPNWGIGALELIRIKESGEAGSFSQYIVELAAKRGKQKSTFYRLISTGRYYQQLYQEFGVQGECFPCLGDADVKASPGTLELLQKICRVVDADTAIDLKRKTMQGAVSRTELRPLWLLHRTTNGSK
jgi:hypothetical protein